MQQQKGFTLLELLVTMAVIVILAGIAYPAYENNVVQSRRSDAQGALQGLAQAMERFYTENGTYDGAAGTQATPATTGAPWIFSSKSPIDGSETFYNLTIVSATGNAYVLKAAPVGAQDGDGALVLKSTGQRGWDSDNSGNGDLGTSPNEVGTAEWCWKKTC